MVQIISFYTIAMGAALLLTRLAQFLTGQLHLESISILLIVSLCAEMLTGFGLILSGVGTLFRLRWAAPVQWIALGMLLFCAVFNWGTVSQRGDQADSIFFAVSAVITMVIMGHSVRRNSIPKDNPSNECCSD
jgi:hypothetical protein